MPKQKPTPEQIARAVRATMAIFDQSVARALANVLKTHGNLDIERIVTMRQVMLFEEELKVIFHSGANILIRRLHAELKKTPGDEDQNDDGGKKTIKLSAPTGALKSIR